MTDSQNSDVAEVEKACFLLVSISILTTRLTSKQNAAGFHCAAAAVTWEDS